MAIRFRVESFFLLVGLGLLAGASYAYYAIVMRPASWPQVDAHIVSSRVVNPGGPNSYAPELVFRLDADGSTRDVKIAPSWSSSSYGVVRSHVDQYPSGRRVKVAVNPGDRDDLRYEVGPTMTNMIAPGVLGLLGVVFSAVGAIAMRAGRKKDEWAPPAFDEAGRPVADGSGAIRLVPRIFALVGVIITAIGGMMIRSDVRMLESWPEIEGRVLESRVVTVNSSGSRSATTVMYDTAVKFHYVVDDVAYENGTRYGVATSSRGGAEARADAYAPGTVHRIWHRPGDPNLIRFDLDGKVHVFFLSGAILAMGLIFLGLGGLLWRFMTFGAPLASEAPEFK